MTEVQQTFSGQALVITVSENLSASIPSLGAAVEADGNAITQTLQRTDICGYAPERVKRLSGRQATFANIQLALKEAAYKLMPNEPFLFFYSGHGGMTAEGGILAPYDTEFGTNTGILRSAELAQMIRDIPSKRKLIVVDACHSGGLALTTSIAKSAKPLSDSIIRDMESGEGVVVIASSRSSEYSYIQHGDSLSLFTKHIVAALEGAAGHDSEGFVRVFDLFNYVAEHVRKEEPMQAPVYAAYHQDSNFPVTYCKSLEKRQQKSGRDASISPKSLLETFCLLYPLGPTDQDIWVRAGGDLSRIKLEGSGRLAWSRAIRDIEKGSLTTAEDIVRAANEDYPQNKKLLALLESLN